MIREWPFVAPAEWRSATPPVDTAEFAAFTKEKIPSEVLLADGEWAGIKRSSGGESAGPTGLPWVDSNGWKIRLLSLQNPGKTIWIDSKEPGANEIIRFDRYLVGIADAAAHHGRWILRFDPAFRRALAAGDATATKNFARLKAAARFFAAKDNLCNLPARAVTAVISDFSGSNETFSQEILNLAARQHLPHLPLDKRRLSALPPGLKAVVYADEQPPTQQLRAILSRFVEAGGVLMTTAAWGKPSGSPLPDSPSVRYAVYPAAKGRIAIPQGEDSGDPFLAAADAQVLLSHRNDVVRLWNGGAMGIYPTGDARHSVVHLISYTGRPAADPVSLWIQGDFQSVTIHSFEFESKQLPIIRRRNGVEVHLPPIAIYAAVEAVA